MWRGREGARGAAFLFERVGVGQSIGSIAPAAASETTKKRRFFSYLL